MYGRFPKPHAPGGAHGRACDPAVNAELHAKIGATMIYVTHDDGEAMTMASQIVILNAGQIEQVGAPMDLYSRPETVFVAGFIGAPKMNLFTGRLAEMHGCETCGIRPEHVAMAITSASRRVRCGTSSISARIPSPMWMETNSARSRFARRAKSTFPRASGYF